MYLLFEPWNPKRHIHIWEVLGGIMAKIGKLVNVPIWVHLVKLEKYPLKHLQCVYSVTAVMDEPKDTSLYLNIHRSISIFFAVSQVA
jgi:hypothetical protein